MKRTRFDAVRGYRIDFSSDTIYLNYKFAAAAERDLHSPEAKRLREIKKMFPTMTVAVKAGREITKPRRTKRLTYKNMETYIGTLNNAKEMLVLFEKKKSESKASISPYKYVRDWFETQFPDYRNSKVFEEDRKSIVAAAESDNVTDFPSAESTRIGA